MANIYKNSLRKNFSWNLVGNLLYSITQWGLIIAITRLGSVELVGLFSLGLAITSPIILFTDLQLRTVQATSTDDQYDIGDYFGIRTITHIVFFIVLFSFLAISDYDLFTTLVIILVAVTKVLESLSDLIYGFFQQKERMELISKSLILRGCGSFVAVAIVLYLSNDILLALISMSITWLIILIFYDKRNLVMFNTILKPRFKLSNFNIIRISLPLGLVVLIVSLNTNIPKVLVENTLGIEALGIFSGITYLVFIGSKFIGSVGNVLLPRLAKLYDSNQKFTFSKYLIILVSLSVLIGIILVFISVFFGEFLLLVIYGTEFRMYQDVLILVMIYGMFNYISYSLMVGLNSMKKFNIQPFLGILWLLISIVSLSVLLPDYGLKGAAMALIIYAISRVLTIVILIVYYLKK